MIHFFLVLPSTDEAFQNGSFALGVLWFCGDTRLREAMGKVLGLALRDQQPLGVAPWLQFPQNLNSRDDGDLCDL